tara:strand:+ start:46689 stop:47828 length:1140 start_codon:yes stop_codon:yes gene_type:complete
LLLTISPLSHAQACKFDDVSFNSDFSGARLDSCEKLAKHQYHIGILPENEPVNPSPWFSFKLHSEHAARVQIKLTFNGNNPRYLPKLSTDGIHWQNIEFDTKGQEMWLSVNTDTKPVWISAQEVIDNQEYDIWLAALQAQRPEILVETLGQSEKGRPIKALIKQSAQNKEWLVVIGRQHPPEVTGAMALFAFSESLLLDDTLREPFFNRFNLLLVPDVNPDGVETGNWRHNANGIDLNRDWKNFAQVETRLVRDKMASIVKNGGKIVFAVDFHSTYHDVFYTMPLEHDLAPVPLVTDWLADLEAETKWIFRPINKSASSPERGIFKQYIADHYKVHGVTYEVGDNTNRQLIPYVAKQAAKGLVNNLLKVEPEAFYVKHK